MHYPRTLRSSNSMRRLIFLPFSFYIILDAALRHIILPSTSLKQSQAAVDTPATPLKTAAKSHPVTIACVAIV
jgi:hypothetical protein